MIRRKLDQRSISKRGLFSKRVTEKTDNNSANTEPTEETNPALDFELPSWENPSNITTRPTHGGSSYPASLSPKVKSQATGCAQNNSPTSRPQMYLQTSSPTREAGDNLTNMLVTCNNSFNSIEDMTCVSFQGDDDSPQQYPASPVRQRSSYAAIKTSANSADSKGFVWKRGPNGKFIKVTAAGYNNDVSSGMPMQERASRPPYQRQQSAAALQRMEEQMLNTALKLSRQESLRSMQVSNSTLDCDEANSPKRSSPSRRHKTTVTESLLGNHEPAECPTALRNQEEALIRLALDRSVHESSPPHHTRNNISSPRSHVLSLGDGRSPSSRRTRTSGTTSPSMRQSSTAAASSSSGPKNFVWKKGPNNRYIKVPIGLDLVEEETTTSFVANDCSNDERERLARMEEALVQEAMKRSMNDA